ncbi:MAG: AAA family ATPase [Alphaproteobacteria bacterium]
MPDNSTDDIQRDVIAFLSRPESYGRDVENVQRIDTHISVVFLAGDRVYKMKRAIRFEYLDYGTLARRRAFCEAEIDTNRRTAPSLYLGVVAVTRAEDGAFQLNGNGEPVEWLVEMRRFDQDSLFDRMAEAGELTPELMTGLADSIFGFHDEAAPASDRGGAAVMRHIIDGNFREIRKSTPSLFDPDKVALLEERSRTALDSFSGLLDERGRAGRIRRCHGDLHLRNICLVDGAPTLFDAIEFNDDISVIDVLYDLAFLLMDLEHRGHRDRANEVFNRYMALGDDVAGLAALPLFLACRAAIRAHTAVAAARTQPDTAKQQSLEAEACAYLDLACTFLEPRAAQLVAIGGLSGTGKSTVAGKVAPSLGRAPGALVLRSDVMRKRLFGVAPETRLDPTAYTRAISERVYDDIAERAALALDAGHCVVADAVFAREAERTAIAAVGRSCGVRVTGVWLDAPAAVLESRVAARRNDASDAGPAVVRDQLDYDLGVMDWHRVDAGNGAGQTVAAVTALLARR